MASASEEYFPKQYGAGTAPLCITDRHFTTIAWLKTPLSAPDLPRRRVIADSLAALQPTPALWRRYKLAIKRARDKGDVTYEQYAVLRHSGPAKRALMDVTLGDVEAYTEGTIAEILERAAESMRADLQESLAREREALEQARARHDEEIRTRDDELARWMDQAAVQQSALDTERDRAARLREAAGRDVAIRVARVLRRLVAAGVAIALVVAILPGVLPPSMPLRLGFLALAVTVAILNYIDLVHGKAVPALIARFETLLAGGVERWLARLDNASTQAVAGAEPSTTAADIMRVELEREAAVTSATEPAKPRSSESASSRRRRRPHGRPR
jgi:hypothetical protein